MRGFVHAHVGWLFSNLGIEQGRLYAKDLYDDRLIRWIDRLYLVWVGLTLGIPFAIGYAVGGTWQAGLEALVWGGLIRIFLYQHATFSVNSICHMFGRKDYRSRDEARNNWLVAALVFGEGWHNNHHAFPASARHGLRPLPDRRLVVGDPRRSSGSARVEREGPGRRARDAPARPALRELVSAEPGTPLRTKEWQSTADSSTTTPSGRRERREHMRRAASGLGVLATAVGALGLAVLYAPAPTNSLASSHREAPLSRRIRPLTTRTSTPSAARTTRTR